MKVLALLFVGAVGLCSAHGSFELMLVGNSVNGTIQRYDAESGTYFGSFGFGTGLKTVTLDRTTNTAFALYAGVVRRFNYNTGSYLGEFSVPANAAGLLAASNQTDFFVSAGTSILRYDVSSGASLGTFSTTPVDVSTLIEYNPGGSFPAYLLALVSDPSSGNDLFRISAAGAVSGYYSGGTGARTTLTRTGGASRFAWTRGFFHFNVDGQGAGAGQNLTGIVSATGSAPAHFGYYFAGQNTTTTTVGTIQHYSTTGTLLRSFNTQPNTTVAGVATVIAPEPIALAPLAMGCIILMRRRRN